MATQYWILWGFFYIFLQMEQWVTGNTNTINWFFRQITRGNRDKGKSDWEKYSSKIFHWESFKKGKQKAIHWACCESWNIWKQPNQTDHITGFSLKLYVVNIWVKTFWIPTHNCTWIFLTLLSGMIYTFLMFALGFLQLSSAKCWCNLIFQT